MGQVYKARDPQLGREVGVKVLPHGAGISGDRLARFGHGSTRASGIESSEHSDGVQRRARSRDSVCRVGAARRRDASRTPSARADFSERHICDRTADNVRPRGGARQRHHPPRSEARKPVRCERRRREDSRFRAGKAGEGKRTTTVSCSIAVIVMGTAGYMSPEQVRGHEADARSDLFSFGAVLHEMVTGHRAFSGSGPLETMRAVCTEEPAGADDVPAALTTILNRCLAKNPAERFDSAHDVAVALMPVAIASQAVSSRPRSDIDVRRRDCPCRYGDRNNSDDAAGTEHLLAQATGRQALAIMQFDDRSGDPADAWLSNGVPSMLVTALAQTPGLDVIGTDRLEASFRELGLAPTDRSARHEAAQHAGAGAVLVERSSRSGRPETRSAGARCRNGPGRRRAHRSRLRSVRARRRHRSRDWYCAAMLPADGTCGRCGR